MSSLTMSEKYRLEKLFDMGSGYVLNFSDRTFGDFLGELGIDIHDGKYSGQGSSKAKKLRELWRIESDHVVSEVLSRLISHRSTYDMPTDGSLVTDCTAIAARLRSGSVPIAALKSNSIVFDSRYISRQVARMEGAIHSDPALAIGTAK